MAVTERFNAYFLAKVYTSAYAFCYMTASLTGLHSPLVGVELSQLILFAIGIGLILSVHTGNTRFIYCMAALEALGCVGHFYEIIQWVPALNTTGYLLMSMLDLSQCIFLLIIIEYKQLAKIQMVNKIPVAPSR
jgi:uncharacterized membrane protein